MLIMSKSSAGGEESGFKKKEKRRSKICVCELGSILFCFVGWGMKYSGAWVDEKNVMMGFYVCMCV
jgi:hypothetical protein